MLKYHLMRQKTRRERVRRNSIKINHEDIINEETGSFWA